MVWQWRCSRKWLALEAIYKYNKCTIVLIILRSSFWCLSSNLFTCILWSCPCLKRWYFFVFVRTVLKANFQGNTVECPSDGMLPLSCTAPPGNPIKTVAQMCLYTHMWCAWVCCLWRVLGWIKRALKCVLAGHDRSVGDNSQKLPPKEPLPRTPHLDWMQHPNPVCHLTHRGPSPPDGEMNHGAGASRCPHSLRNYSGGESRDDLIRGSRWDQMVRWQVRESGEGTGKKKRRDKERESLGEGVGQREGREGKQWVQSNAEWRVGTEGD